MKPRDSRETPIYNTNAIRHLEKNNWLNGIPEPTVCDAVAAAAAAAPAVQGQDEWAMPSLLDVARVLCPATSASGSTFPNGNAVAEY